MIIFNNLSNNEVAFFPYRTARVRDIMVEIAGAEVDFFLEELIDNTKKIYENGKFVEVENSNYNLRDNHVVFQIGEHMAVAFSDNILFVGEGVVIEPW